MSLKLIVEMVIKTIIINFKYSRNTQKRHTRNKVMNIFIKNHQELRR